MCSCFELSQGEAVLPLFAILLNTGVANGKEMTGSYEALVEFK